MIRSPFFVVEEALSPAKCEKLVAELGIRFPNLDEHDKPIKNERIMTEHASVVRDVLQPHLGDIEERYDATVKGMETPLFQQFFENPKDPPVGHGCESAKFLRKKWVKVKDIDLVGFIWLKDFNSGVPLDPRFEVYGGKLEFPAYDFSLVPQRGTLVLYPAGPHFITCISPVLIGSLEQVKVTMKLRTTDDGIYLYQPQRFPGTYGEWFTQG
jgi:hypothetical protein